MPSAAQRVLLQQRAAGGARLRYHGDFDWPGIRIGTIVIGRLGAAPWRFDAADYRPAAGKALEGAPVAACWDPALAGRMRAAGTALHEETAVDLLADLAVGGRALG